MAETQLTIDTTLAFDENKQAAIIGWALRDKTFFVQCMNAVKAEWFSSPLRAKIFGAMAALYGEYHRPPSAAEVGSYRPFTQEDARTYTRIKEALVDCIKKTDIYGLDILRQEMTQWMHAVIFAQCMLKATQTYNAAAKVKDPKEATKKVEEAWATVEDANLLKVTATFEEGTNQGFAPSAERILVERDERIRQAKLLLPYGVTYLDDSFGGIISNDLIVIGAKTGAGKTQLATSISLTTAQGGNPAHYFALEAEENEIERRIKYGMVSDHYYRKCKERGDGAIYIRYTDWRQGRHDDIFHPIEKEIQDQLVEAVKNLHTLYRTSGVFDLKALEKNLLRVVHETRLIVIDHLHYIDTDDDENYAYKRVIKLIRDIVLKYGVPVIVIAHLRKNQNTRTAPLMNSIEDFHGTSDVPKVATTCIMMSPAHDHIAPQPWLWPTYIGGVKSRLDGSCTRYVGLTHFDARKGLYEPGYRVGRLKDMGQEWEEALGAGMPPWARVDDSIVTEGIG
jgi:replicative DNA helicase